MKKRRIVSVIFVVLFAALLAQVIWCLCKHHDTNKVEVSGITMEDVLSENKRLTEENTELKALLDVEDGECHGTCEIHCPCTHADVKVEEGEWSFTDAKPEDVCQQGIRDKKIICTKCGEILEETTELKAPVAHSYQDGVCAVCGHKTKTSSTTTAPAPVTTPAPCSHSNTTKEYGEWAKSLVKTESVCFAESRTVKTVCTSCKAVIGQDTETRQDTEHFYKNNKCEDCGFEHACTHSTTKAEYGDWQTKVVGNTKVCYEETRTVKTICTECGKLVSEDKESKETTEHFFKNGQCAFCDLEDANANCKHTGGRTLQYGDWYEVEVGTEACCHADVRDIYYVCNKCGEIVGTATQDKKYDYYHSYRNGICTDCGYGSYTNTNPDSDWNSWTHQDNSALPNPVDDGGYNGEYGIYGDYSDIPEPIN